ncbi:unnamed protein product [Ilex paraguariensis]|uniref:Uncharacterized protein n=1 Tax=Ilex paraguariensis TaxID=185542 RepID=A0ABC8R4V7_9AQUA
MLVLLRTHDFRRRISTGTDLLVDYGGETKNDSAVRETIAGSLGGIVEACCLQPVDVIKTRLQLDRSGSYKGIIHCGATVIRTEGVRALWKGLTPFATHLTLKYALRMGSNAVLQSAFKDPKTGNVSPHGRVLAGFGAGVIEALVIVTPFEAFYTRSRFSVFPLARQLKATSSH